MAKLLIIDDQIDLLHLYKENLVEAGHEAIVFSDSNKALEHINANPNLYDLIISDFVMPALNGVELFNEVIKSNGDNFSDFIIHSTMSPKEINSLIGDGPRPLAIIKKRPELDYIVKLVARYEKGEFS